MHKIDAAEFVTASLFGLWNVGIFRVEFRRSVPYGMWLTNEEAIDEPGIELIGSRPSDRDITPPLSFIPRGSPCLLMIFFLDSFNRAADAAGDPNPTNRNLRRFN